MLSSLPLWVSYDLHSSDLDTDFKERLIEEGACRTTFFVEADLVAAHILLEQYTRPSHAFLSYMQAVVR